MCRSVAALLSLAIVIVLGAGCSEESSSFGGSSSDDSSAARESVTDLLIQRSDLPSGAKVEKEGATTSCDPLKELRKSESEAAKSTVFAIGETRIQEAVGIFARMPEAVDALDALHAQSRLDCIRATIEFQRQSVRVEAPRALRLGDEAKSIRLRARSEETGRVSSIDIVSIRLGRATAGLLLVSPTPTMPPAIFTDTVDAAVGLLAAEGDELRARR